MIYMSKHAAESLTLVSICFEHENTEKKRSDEIAYVQKRKKEVI